MSLAALIGASEENRYRVRVRPTPPMLYANSGLRYGGDLSNLKSLALFEEVLGAQDKASELLRTNEGRYRIAEVFGVVCAEAVEQQSALRPLFGASCDFSLFVDAVQDGALYTLGRADDAFIANRHQMMRGGPGCVMDLVELSGRVGISLSHLQRRDISYVNLLKNSLAALVRRVLLYEDTAILTLFRAQQNDAHIVPASTRRLQIWRDQVGHHIAFCHPLAARKLRLSTGLNCVGTHAVDCVNEIWVVEKGKRPLGAWGCPQRIELLRSEDPVRGRIGWEVALSFAAALWDTAQVKHFVWAYSQAA